MNTSSLRDHGNPPAELHQLLKILARMLAEGREPGAAAFRALLLGAGLEKQQDAVQELGRWCQILHLLHANPTSDVATAVFEALTIRGVPAAPAREAIALIKGESMGAATTRSGQLSASVEVLHLGTPVRWSLARGEFDILGGPGTITAEDSRLAVSPRRFPFGLTRVSVQARASDDGRFGRITIRANHDYLEIPVVLRCQPGLERPQNQAPATPLVPEPPVAWRPRLQEPMPMAPGADALAQALKLRGCFVRDDFQAQGLVGRIGYGAIHRLEMADPNHIFVFSDLGVMLIHTEDYAVLWQIECPCDHGSLGRTRELLSLVDDLYCTFWSVVDGSLAGVREKTVFQAPANEVAPDTTSPTQSDSRSETVIENTNSEGEQAVIIEHPGAAQDLVSAGTTDEGECQPGDIISLEDIDLSNDSIDDEPSDDIDEDEYGKEDEEEDDNRTYEDVWDVYEMVVANYDYDPVEISDDDRYVVGAAIDGLYLYHAPSGVLVEIWDAGYGFPIDKVAFNADSSMLAAADEVGNIFLYDIATDEEIQAVLDTPKDRREIIYSGSYRCGEISNLGHCRHLEFSPDGRTLTCCYNQTWGIFDATRGYELAVFNTALPAPTYSVFSEDDSVLAIGHANTLYVWSAESQAVILELRPSETPCDFLTTLLSPDGRYLVIHTARGCKVWNLKGNESGPGDPIELGYHPFAFALDGRSILSVEKEDPGYLWIYRLGTPDEPPDYRWFYCKDQFAQLFLSRATHKPWIVSPSLAFVAGFCGAEILLWYLDGSTYCLPGAEDDEEDIYQDICDDPTATRQGTLVGHSAAITNLLFSPDEQLLASASADGTVRLWETATGICRQQLRGQKAEIGQIAFSASGDSLTAIDAKGVTYVWSIPDGHELSRLVPPDGHRPLPALSHDGRIAATYTDEPPRVYIWSIPEQRNIAQMPGTLAGISPNGRMAALYRSPVREAELPFATDDEDADSAYTIWRIPESVHGPEA